jgi:hypothetical protein
MASTLVALQTVTVGAGGASSVEFTNIPQTYNDLVIKASLRTNTGSIDAGTYFYVNGAAIGVAKKLGGTGSAAFSDNGANIIDQGSGATANTFSNGEIYFPNYTNTGIKSMSVDWVNETNATTIYMNMLALTETVAAVTFRPATSVKLAPFSGANSFLQYSTVTLYGVYKDAAETTPAAPTIGTATAGSQAADVAFTPAGSGAPAISYVVTSSPGGLTATGGSSPIQIGGLTSGTAYTFTVRGQNPGGLGAASAASNSVTPYDGYESIATLYGNGTSSITFSSIPSTYTHLQIRANVLSGATYSDIQINSDTGANYSWHQLYGTGASVSAAGGGSANQIYALQMNGSTTYPTVGIIDILDYANTNKYKTVRMLAGLDTNGGGELYYRSGAWLNTNAISTLTIRAISGTATFASGSTFELYGIRG